MTAASEWPWPPMEVYAMFVTCPRCWAKRGNPCTTKREKYHIARADEGNRRYARDVGKAPWIEDRIDGVRYDSLGDFWVP